METVPSKKVAIPEKLNTFMATKACILGGLHYRGPGKDGKGGGEIRLTDAQLEKEMSLGIHPTMAHKPISGILNHCVAIELTSKGEGLMAKLEAALAPEPKKEKRKKKAPVSIDDALAAKEGTATPADERDPAKLMKLNKETLAFMAEEDGVELTEDMTKKQIIEAMTAKAEAAE